jgi:hypothetical protein
MARRKDWIRTFFPNFFTPVNMKRDLHILAPNALDSPPMVSAANQGGPPEKLDVSSSSGKISLP